MKKLLTLFTALFFALSMMATDVLSINFTQGQGDWIINDVNLDGLSYVWSYSTQYGMKASGYAGGEHETESWLISPAFDLSEAISYATLAFSHARKFGDTNQLHVMARRNSYANWDELSVSAWPDGSNWNFIDATADLSAYIGSSSVQVAFIYTSSSTGAPTWEIKTVNVSADSQTPIYYLVGSMTNWNPAAGYQFAENPTVSGEYTLDITLHAGDELKVVQTIDGTITTWYPDGNNNNYYVSEMGNYTVYFYPAGGMEDAYYGYYYLEKKTYPRYNVTEAINAGLQNNTEIEVRGVVTGMEIKGTNFANYGSVIFYLEDVNGTEGEFKLYNCYSINESHFTATDPAYDAESTAIVNPTSVTDANGNMVHVGDTIVAFGKYLFYNNSIYELNTGCYLIDTEYAPKDIHVNINSNLVLNDLTDNMGAWQVYTSGVISIAVWSSQIAGTYTVDNFYNEYAWIYDTASDQRIYFTAGSITVTASDNLDTVQIVGTLTGNDGNYYLINMEYTDPVAQSEETLMVADAGLYDISDGFFQFYGQANDTCYVGLGIWSDIKPGTYTEDDLHNNYSFIRLNNQYFSLFDAEITVTEHADGSYTIIADLLCNNNILYHVTMTVPVYYLVGTMNDWTPTEGYRFELGDFNYTLNTTLAVGDELKVVQVVNGSIIKWYPEGQGNNFYVTDRYAGEKTVYFNPYGYEEWVECHDGGFIYIQKTPEAEAEETIEVESARFYVIEDGCFQVAGWANDTIAVALALWNNTKPGTYTEDDVNHDYSFIINIGDGNTNYIYIYDADITITENADGSHTVTADLLCYNDILYHVTLKVPVYCLVGSMNDWTPLKAYQFEINPNNSEEYMLNVTLAENDAFKVVRSYNNDIQEWYPNGQSNDYIVAANYAGEKTVYFRPEGNTAWESFHEGGYFYMEENFVPQDIYITITSDVSYLDNTATSGWWLIKSATEDYTISLSNNYSLVAEGTYTVADLYADDSYIYYTNGTTIQFADGSITLSIDANSGNVTVSGTLIGNDGNYYHIYMLYIAPVAQNEETIVIPNAVFDDDYWESDGLFQVYGYANDTLGVALGVFSESRAGSYTKDNLYADWSYISINNNVAYVYEASITIVENEDGSYTVLADLLCDNNTLYHVTMTVPAPEETAIDNAAVDAKAVKLIRDGQLIIIKNGVHYNAQGAVVR